MNAEHGIFHIHSTKWGSLSLKKRNPLLSSLWCSIHSACSQHNPQQVDIWLSSKGYKNTFLLFPCLLLLFFFLRLRYVLAMSSALTIPKEMPQINFSTSVQRHINSNYAPCSQGRDLLLEVFSMPPQKQPSDRIPFSILILNRLHTHHVTCEAYTSLIKACSNLNK